MAPKRASAKLRISPARFATERASTPNLWPGRWPLRLHVAVELIARTNNELNELWYVRTFDVIAGEALSVGSRFRDLE